MKSSTRPAPRRAQQRTEQGYVRSALIALRRLGIPCAWEAALLGRSVDLALLQEDALWTVEFKKRDWRRALRQAQDHLLGADYAYICLAECEPSQMFLDAARDAGVGVLRLRDTKRTWPFDVVVQAARSRETLGFARERVVNQLRLA